MKNKTDTLEIKEGFYKCAGKCGKIKPEETMGMLLLGKPVCKDCLNKGDW
jgi:hypothetical protein